jgi:hypothetical protein
MQEGLFNAHMQRQGIATNFIEDSVYQKVTDIFPAFPFRT